MKKLIVVVILSLFLITSPLHAVTKCVGHDDTVILFLDKDENNVYDKIILIKTNEPKKVITMDEAQEIIKTFPIQEAKK